MGLGSLAWYLTKTGGSIAVLDMASTGCVATSSPSTAAWGRTSAGDVEGREETTRVSARWMEVVILDETEARWRTE